MPSDNCVPLSYGPRHKIIQSSNMQSFLLRYRDWPEFLQVYREYFKWLPLEEQWKQHYLLIGNMLFFSPKTQCPHLLSVEEYIHHDLHFYMYANSMVPDGAVWSGSIWLLMAVHCLILLKLYTPVNILVMSGRFPVFLSWTSTKKGIF